MFARTLKVLASFDGAGCLVQWDSKLSEAPLDLGHFMAFHALESYVRDLGHFEAVGRESF